MIKTVNSHAFLCTYCHVNPWSVLRSRGFSGVRKNQSLKLFETPNALRDGGFNLAIGGKASTNVRGEYRLFSIAGYQARFVSREGIFGLMVIGTDEFMAWVTGSTPPMVKFNPLVLAELTYEFCRFVKELIVFAKPTPASLIFQLQLFGYDANQLSVALPRAGISVSRIISFFPPSEIGSTDLCLQIEVPAEDTPEKAALQLLDELYIKSGLDTDKVPYANRSTGTLDVGLIESGG